MTGTSPARCWILDTWNPLVSPAERRLVTA
jgi:hypothetical protein